MNLRQKLLLLFSLTVAAAVAAVSWTVLVRIRQVFDRQDQEKTSLLVNQFQREFQHRSTEVASAVDRLASAERVRSMAVELVQSGDASPYLTEAQSLAADAQVDFLEIVGPDGNIVSSAQWPARFGYPEPAVNSAGTQSFIQREDLPDGASALGVFAVRAIHGAPQVHLIGGKRLDQQFLADLPTPAGVEAYLYSNSDASTVTPTASAQESFDPRRLIGGNGEVPNAQRYQSIITNALHNTQPSTSILYPTLRREDSVSATVLPLLSDKGQVMAVLVVAASRHQMVEAQNQIRANAYGVAAAGILVAIAFSLWISARVSRPIEELARASEQVAQGNWDAQVPVRTGARSRDEVGTLARSFNHMTGELRSQRDRLIQSERVAAWRELARRLAHELKNPLFPLQLTVENLVRARQLPESEFDEVFRESTRTLNMEIANLKTIIGRFSDFSKMPKPQLERIDAADAITRVGQLYFPWKAPAAQECDVTSQGQLDAKQDIDCCIVLDPDPMPIDADPEMLHRALSNLVLNAMDAMPDGGKLTLSAKSLGDTIEMRVEDTGTGLTPEECQRLFTPYYTTKQHGTGLGLDIVQSVVADHAGTIAVESQSGGGAAFVLHFPRAKPADEV